jgi:site-specific recombinase XerD
MIDRITDDCPQILREFLVYIETILNRSSNTVLSYYYDLRLFLRFIKLHKNIIPKNTVFEEIKIADVDAQLISRITTSDIYEFIHFISSKNNNRSYSRARKVSTLRSFFKYLTKKTHLLDYDPMLELDNPKKSKSIVKYLTIEQSISLLNSIDGKFKERDYCIIVLFLNCGLRLSELVGINENDIKENKLVVTGKGNKQRLVYLNEACLNAIENYMKYKSLHYKDTLKREPALFISRNLKRIDKRSVQLIVEKYLKAANLDNMGFSTHKLRHTAATLMYQHGNVDVRTLQEVLGHENLSTTQIYTHVSNEQTKKAIESNPLSNIKPKENK